jgi:shikimate 5-dehydrogenase
MLLHQAARSFELWTGLEPPLAAMRAALPVRVSGTTT